MRRFNNDSDAGGARTTCHSLAANFNSNTLNAFQAADVRDPVFRLPCGNCQVLLPTLDVPTGQAMYDADLWALDPAGAGAVW